MGLYIVVLCRRPGHEAWTWISPAGCGYKALFATAINQGDLTAIRDCTHKGWALGGKRFRAEIEALGRGGRRPRGWAAEEMLVNAVSWGA